LACDDFCRRLSGDRIRVRGHCDPSLVEHVRLPARWAAPGKSLPVPIDGPRHPEQAC
jgi:hypothetical protein